MVIERGAGAPNFSAEVPAEARRRAGGSGQKRPRAREKVARPRIALEEIDDAGVGGKPS
jgi:hypothetical protein